MIVLFTSTEPALEQYQRALVEALPRANGTAVTVRHAPLTTVAEERAAALRDADVVVCLVGDSSEPELPDGSGHAETQVEAAHRLGVPVLAYARVGAHAPLHLDDPLQGYSVARARRLRNWLRERYGVRRFSTPDELIRGVTEAIATPGPDNGSRQAPTVRRLQQRLQARTTSFDAYAISLHNMDAIYRVQEIAPLREEIVASAQRFPGGATANAVYALARLGLTTGVAGATADDADGRALRDNLQQAGVATDLLLRLDPSATVHTGRAHIFTDARGQLSIFTEAGANSRFAAELDARGRRRALLDDLMRARVVLLTTFDTAPERDLQEELLGQLPAETLVAYMPGSLYQNPGPRRLAPIVRRANVVFISEEALRRLLDGVVAHAGDTTGSIAQQVHRLIQWRYDLGARDPVMVVVRPGHATRDALRHIYVAWGLQGFEDGADTDGRVEAEDLDKVVDGTGSGGAIAAGVLYALLRGRPPEDCANLAFVMALSSVTRYGSRDGIPSRETIRERWRYWLKVDAPSWL